MAVNIDKALNFVLPSCNLLSEILFGVSSFVDGFGFGLAAIGADVGAHALDKMCGGLCNLTAVPSMFLHIDYIAAIGALIPMVRCAFSDFRVFVHGDRLTML